MRNLDPSTGNPNVAQSSLSEKRGMGSDTVVCRTNRSPWSNSYDPPLEDGGAVPSGKMRAMEENANEMLNVYREL